MACAAPIERPPALSTAPSSGLADQTSAPRYASGSRQTIGVAFGGGSARGIAHVGVIRWFDEHRIPIDMVAGTSMGGLIGGAFAAGMDAAELEAMLASIDWDEMFGSTNFAFKNIRRKADAGAFPSGLEFGMKRGLAAPTALNDGVQVELLLARIAAAYSDLDFNQLPTPFRAVAVDLITARQVVLSRGSLARAMRATMSLPFIFPPVEMDGRVLVDGGAMNNVPADLVQAMGADRIVAVNVGDLTNPTGISYTLLGVSSATLDAMMRASTREAIAAADVIVNVPLAEYGALDWRRRADLVGEGYAAAEAMRDELLPFAVSEADYQRWKQDRQSRRRSMGIPASVSVEGFDRDDAGRLRTRLSRHVGVPLVVEEVERDLELLAGLDRYEAITWSLGTSDNGDAVLRVIARPKVYAPPFMMLGLNMENTTSSDFQISATARYLAYGATTSDSELRIDGTLGSNPSAAVELYEPIASTPLFVAPYAAVATSTFNRISDDTVVARYNTTVARAGGALGVNLGSQSDVRIGAYIGHVDARAAVGDPGVPGLTGRQSAVEVAWRLNGWDRPVIPTHGTVARVRLSYVFEMPEVAADRIADRFSSSVTQLSGSATRFWSRGAASRVFLYGAFGTSFNDVPLPTSQFALGSPLRLGSFRLGELLGDHYWIGTGGYFHRVGRLPDFIGGAVFAGAWLENGDAFDDWNGAGWRTDAGVGIVMDTLLGPVTLTESIGFGGRWRTYVGIGRIFD